MAATAQVVVPYLEYCQHSNSRHDMMTRTPGPDLQHHILGCDDLPDSIMGRGLHPAVGPHEVLVEEVAVEVVLLAVRVTVEVVCYGHCWPVLGTRCVDISILMMQGSHHLCAPH